MLWIDLDDLEEVAMNRDAHQACDIITPLD